MKRNFFRLLLSAVLMMCCTVMAWADLGTPPDYEIWYTTDNDKMLSDSKYKVGETLCNHKITAHDKDNGHFYIRFDGNIDKIYENAFNDQDDITEISLPNSIVNICEKAFNDCDGLVTFHMPNSVHWLGYCAFYHCNNLKDITFSSNLESIGYAEDSYGVFEECDALESVTLPASVKYIGRNAFYDCDALKSFSCENLEYIYPQAFYHCDVLKSVNLGTKLKEIQWSSQGRAYGLFEECDELEAIAIPASVTSIGRKAFYDCDMLKFVAIGSGVTRINEQAFYNCDSLKSVAIDGNGVSIGKDAFNDCEKLESVSFLGNMPPMIDYEGALEIGSHPLGDYCFGGCSKNLRYYVLEKNYDSYNDNEDLSGKVVAGPPYNEIWYTTNNRGAAGYTDSKKTTPPLNAHMGNHGVQFFNGNPPEFSSDGNCFFACSNLVSAVLPSSITYIGKNAFYNCTNLVSVSIPSTVTGIGYDAFYKCYSLQNIKLPDGLNFIGIDAFHGSSLQSITIPSMVNAIPELAFVDCNNLRSVTILGTIQSIGALAFSCDNLFEIFYLGEGTPECVTRENNGPFYLCPATIYVKDATGRSDWDGRPVRSWRSGRGDGSAANPLEIGNYQQLYGFSLEVEYMNGANLCAKLTNDITGSNNVLNEDGTPKGIFKQWLPIGSWDNNYNSSYKGEFDGGGHTVSGLFVNDETMAPVGLFGMANGANIHDVGVKDSYFRGKSHVAGICGDFASGQMENCWNGATVQSAKGTAGGIAGSCWHSASMSNCHNVGKVEEGTFCGGICGSVAKNTAGVTNSVSNCVSLEGKCSVAYNLYESGVGINNVSTKNASAFASGEVCWILNGSQPSDKWRQQLGVDSYPTLSGDYFVYNRAGTNKYYNYDDNISGSGTADDPYRIGNKFELLMFADIVNDDKNTAACGILTADITINTGVLDSDGNLNSGMFEAWTPIGGEGYGYKGEFNGNGHTISGLYFSDANRQAVGLFGKAAGSESDPADRAYIHDVGVRDSYFNGISHVGGICGDFALGRIENCWNAATVQSVNSVAGGIAGSCWRYASMSGCYNIGKVSEGTESGGVCGIVSKNNEVDYSVSNCVSLYGKCSVAYNLYPTTSQTYADDGGAKVNNVFNDKDAEAFASGEVCWMLNGSKYGGHWRQQLETDDYPTLSGTYFVNYTSERQYYNNEPLQEIWYTSTDGKIVTPNDPAYFGAGITSNTYCGDLGIITFDKAVTCIGSSAFYDCSSLKSIEIPDNVTSIGDHAFRGCSSLQSATIPNSVTSIGYSAFSRCESLRSVSILSDSKLTSIGENAFEYCSLLKEINIPSGVTSILEYAFNYCSLLKEINIPSGVTYIGKEAFANCKSLTTITFNSLPVLGTHAFYPCANLNNRILDLTDSDKPYIGNKMNDYHPFTEARYHRTLEKDKWGTIVLPFKPSTESTKGLKFYVLQSMTLRQAQGESGNGGSLTFMKVDAPDAGIPYLFKNEGESADFTLTAETPSSIILETQEIGTTDFTMKGSFKQTSLNTTDKPNDNLYYLKGNEFWHANGQINIAPFRAYIEGSGTSDVKSFVLVVSDNGEDITAIPGIMDEDGTLDETEAIYDLSGRRLAAPVKGQINIIRTKSGKTIKRLF